MTTMTKNDRALLDHAFACLSTARQIQSTRNPGLCQGYTDRLDEVMSWIKIGRPLTDRQRRQCEEWCTS